ncbi:MAG TPA: 3-dehydroquinate synthase [Candidatus Xenobia bacterium]|nr:3-dehydroquinate synthase [Candidatus Xenobia bacterium]
MPTSSRSQTSTVWVRTPSARYPVWVGRGVLGRAGKLLRRLRPGAARVFVVSSPRVWSRWGRELTAGLRAGRFRVEPVLINDREEAKRLATLERLAEKLLQLGADRHSLLVALGGGVIGDITGFLAATYMRGLDYSQAPTTVVAQVDSAIGGKTGVNLPRGKNLLGAFHHPLAVVADPRTLETLPAREFRAGLYEVIKCGVIGDPGLFRFLENAMGAVAARRGPGLHEALFRALRLKARIVAQDERERGIRSWLNFGHTFGHAFEALGGYRGLRHGEAVGWGMIAATLMSARLGLIGGPTAARIVRLVASVGPLPSLPRFTPERVYWQMFTDKKKRGGRLRFVLPRGIGRVEIVENVPRPVILRVLRDLRRGAFPR